MNSNWTSHRTWLVTQQLVEVKLRLLPPVRDLPIILLYREHTMADKTEVASWLKFVKQNNKFFAVLY